MKQNSCIIIPFFLFLVISICLSCSEAQTPLDYARKQSELALPDNLNLISFQEDWRSINGDGYRKIAFTLTESQVQKLEDECKKNGYRTLPIKEDGFHPTFLDKKDKGYYKLKMITGNSFELTIFNVEKRQLFLIYEVR